jgi:Ca2+-binding EF-hand superfamily protein
MKKYINFSLEERDMTRKNKMLYDALIDYVSFFYNCSDMPEVAKLNALKIFELLQDEKIDVNDFIPVMRQIQFSLDMIAV